VSGGIGQAVQEVVDSGAGFLVDASVSYADDGRVGSSLLLPGMITGSIRWLRFSGPCGVCLPSTGLGCHNCDTDTVVRIASVVGLALVRQEARRSPGWETSAGPFPFLPYLRSGWPITLDP